MKRVPFRLLLLLAGLTACLRYLLAETARLRGDLGFPLDDSWIHLQFARNLAHGFGLSYNPGDLVTGSTAPLWTALLAVLFVLPGSVVLWTKVLGIGLYLAGIDATWRLARELGLPRGLSALAAALTLATGWLVWSALSGMEIPLFILLSLWGMILHLRELRDSRDQPARQPLSLGVLAVAVLARPEGLLLLLLAVIDRVLSSGRRPAWRTLLAGAVLAVSALAGTFFFYAWAGGSVLPTTYAAKGGGEIRHLLPDFRYLANVLNLFFRAQPWTVLLAGAGAAALVTRLGAAGKRQGSQGLLPALWLFGLPLAYSLLTPGPTKMLGNFGRYYFPLFPVLAVLGMLGLESAWSAVAPRLPTAARAILGIVGAAVILSPTLFSFVQGERLYVQNVANVEESDVAIARWLAPRLPPEASLAVNDIGAIKYLLPNRVIDLASIATPEIGREVAGAMAAGTPWSEALLASVARRQPDYVVVFPSWFPSLARDPRFRAVHVLPIPNNITMGGGEIVVYETPWTRYRLR